MADLPTLSNDLIQQLRGIFYPKDRSVILERSNWLGVPLIDTPSVNPNGGWYFVYLKDDGGLYGLDSNGTEFILASRAVPLLPGGGTEYSVLTRTAAAPVWSDYHIIGTAGRNYTFPNASGTVALLEVANVFTATQTISNTAPILNLTDTTGAAKSLTIAVDANVANIRESAGAAGSLLALDLVNNRVGIGNNAPGAQLQVTSSAAAVIGQIIKGAASQSGNLSEWQNSSGTILGKVTAAGYLDLTQTVNQATTPSVNASQTAETLQDGSAYTGTDATMATQWIAVKFTASAAHTMGDFQIKIKESADLTNTTATLTGYIYSDDGGVPSKPNALLATGLSIRFGTITAAYQVLSVGTTFNLVNGVDYWLVLKYSAVPVGGNIVLDSDVSANMGATSADGLAWANTNVRLYQIIRGLTYQALYGSSTNQHGVYGTSVNSYGVRGFSTNNIGIIGSSTNTYGIYGTSVNNPGVAGVSTNSSGMTASSVNSYGIFASSTSNNGIYATSTTSRAAYFYRNNVAGTATTAVVDIIQDSAVAETNTVLRVQGDGTGDLVNIFDGATEVFTILDGGNLGINKTAPGAMLHIVSSAAAVIGQIIEGAAAQSGDYFQINTNGGSNGDVFVVEASGEVGINTINPATQLEVTASGKTAIKGTSDTVYGVYGISTDTYGVYGSSTSGAGVYGFSTDNIGVSGNSTNSWGVYGTSTNNVAVRGASLDNVAIYGISTNSTGVYGQSTVQRAGYFYRNNVAGSANTAVVDIVQDSATTETNTVLRIQGDGTGDLINVFDGATEVFTILDGGKVGINIIAPATLLHIDQSSTTAALPVVTIDQGDIDEPFIKYIGTCTDGAVTGSIVEAADVGTATLVGYLKMEVQDDGNVLTDQDYYMPIYTLAAP